jgi:hypothetical protein
MPPTQQQSSLSVPHSERWWRTRQIAGRRRRPASACSVRGMDGGPESGPNGLVVPGGIFGAKNQKLCVSQIGIRSSVCPPLAGRSNQPCECERGSHSSSLVRPNLPLEPRKSICLAFVRIDFCKNFVPSSSGQAWHLFFMPTRQLFLSDFTSF